MARRRAIEKSANTTALMIDKYEVAKLLACSWRTVDRWADQGVIPAPVRLGAMVRWNRSVIEEWIRKGCAPVRKQP